MPNGKRKERDKRAALNTRGGGIAETQGKERLLLLAATRYMFVVNSRGQQRAQHSAIIRARAYSSFRVDGGATFTGQGPVKG